MWYTLVVYALLLVVTVLGFIGFTHTIAKWDVYVARFMYELRHPLWLFFFFVVTGTGKWYVVTVLAAACVGVMYHTTVSRRYILPFLVTLAGTGISVWASKLLFHRVRPGGLLPTYVEQSYSFPSGHSAIAIALYGFLVYMLLRQKVTHKVRVGSVAACVLLIFLIGLSRLYLGVHYLSDVWGGYMLGAAWLIVGMLLAETSRGAGKK